MSAERSVPVPSRGGGGSRRRDHGSPTAPGDRRPPLPAVVAVVLALAGCAGGLLGSAGAFDRHFETGQYDRAVAAFEADSVLQREEGPLFRVGLLYATPGKSHYDPARARGLLERLLELHPDTRYRQQAEGLLWMARRLEQTESRVARLEEELEVTRGRVSALEEKLEETGARAGSLEEELEEAESRAARLKKQLEQLKRVHLGQPPDTGGVRYPR